MQVTLFTAIYGAYDDVKPVPHDLGVPAFFFTDSTELATQAAGCGWTPRLVRHSIATLNGEPRVTNPMLNHKWWKTHPHLAAPEADVSVWIDGSMSITHNNFIQACIEALGDDDWAQVRHPERSCIYTESEVTQQLSWRYDAARAKAQTDSYSTFHPRDWGLPATGHIVRRHTPGVLKAGEQWWDECVNWTHQDQLSLPVILRLNEAEVRTNYNIPWHQWWLLGGHNPTWE